MAFVRPKARILERSISTGNGPYALAGAVDGSYNTFASFMAIGDMTEASVVEPGVAFWTGIVTYSAANQITMTTVEETKGTFGSGTKEIFAGGLASRALLREDMSGAILTGGNPIAYTVESFRDYDTLARLDGKAIAFTPHATNGATVTLSVDGLPAKPLRAAPSVELLPNVLIQGTPYLALYNHADQVFYLHGFFGNPHNVPLGSGLDYWGRTTPNSAFVFPAGQAISRATYSELFTVMGTAFGSGDGSTTFNLPDKRGRVSAAWDAMGGAGAGRFTPAFGAAIGEQYHTFLTGELPAHSHSGTATTGIDYPDHTHTIPIQAGVSTVRVGGPTDNTVVVANAANPVSGGRNQNHVHDLAITTNGGNGVANNPVNVTQPTITCNYIIRVL
jgi:microcystin-dependent protein